MPIRKLVAHATAAAFGWWWILVEGGSGQVWLRRVRVNEFGSFVIADEYPALKGRARVRTDGTIESALSMRRWKHFSGDRGRQAFYVTMKLRQHARWETAVEGEARD